MFGYPTLFLLEILQKAVNIIGIQVICTLALQFTFKWVTDLLSLAAFSALTGSLNWTQICTSHLLLCSAYQIEGQWQESWRSYSEMGKDKRKSQLKWEVK